MDTILFTLMLGAWYTLYPVCSLKNKPHRIEGGLVLWYINVLSQM